MKDNQQDLELHCSVIGVKPPVALRWTTSGMEGNVDTFGSTIPEKQIDGTWNIAANLRIHFGDVGDVNMVNFTCTAKGAAVNGSVEETVQIYVSTDSNGNDRSMPEQILSKGN